MKYWFNGMFVLNFVWKARRKEKDAVVPSQEEPKVYLESKVLECAVPDLKLKEVVDLPSGLEYNEWLASHTIAFFDHINMIYGTISEFCTMSGCPDMTGPCGRQYLWFDEKGKKCKVAAPQYIDYVMTFTQKTVYDESIFPTKFDKDFPSSFVSIVKKILRLLLHVLAHIYHAHFKEILLLHLHAHLNCLFSHFMLFNERFKMVDEKETDILQDLAEALQLFSKEKEADTVPTDQNEKVFSESSDKSDVLGNDVDIQQKNCVRDKRPNSSSSSVFHSQSSQSIASSITALHSRSSSGSHSSTGSCAMDSALYSLSSSATSYGSSPLKFQ